MTIFFHPLVDISEYGLSLDNIQSLFCLNPLDITWTLKQTGIKIILNGTVYIKDDFHVQEESYSLTDIWYNYPKEIIPMLKNMKINIEYKILVKIQCLSDD